MQKITLTPGSIPESLVFVSLHFNHKNLNTEEYVWPHFLDNALFVTSVANLPLIPGNRDQDGGACQILTDSSTIFMFRELNFQSFYPLSIWSCMQKGRKTKTPWMCLRSLKDIITWEWVPEGRSCLEQQTGTIQDAANSAVVGRSVCPTTVVLRLNDALNLAAGELRMAPAGQYKEVVFTLPVLPLGPWIPSSLAPDIPFSPLGPGAPDHREEISVTSLHFAFHPELMLLQSPHQALRCWSRVTALGNRGKYPFPLILSGHLSSFPAICPWPTGLQLALICSLICVKMEIFHKETHSTGVSALTRAWGPLPCMDQTNHKAELFLWAGAEKSGLQFLHEIAHETSTSQRNRRILIKYHCSYF